MNVMDYVFDFFKRLVRSRVDSVEIAAKSKVRNVEYKAKSAVANKFNKAIDGTVDKAKAKVTPKKKDEPEKTK